MNIDIRDTETGEHLGAATTFEGVDAILAGRKGQVEIVMNCGILLSPRVLRKPGERDMVSIRGPGGIEKLFTRDSDALPGDLCVSCEASGADVPVWTINVQFRPYNNPAVEKGTVWVQPDDTTSVARFYLRPRTLVGLNETAGDITKAAHEAVTEKVFRHFT